MCGLRHEQSKRKHEGCTDGGMAFVAAGAAAAERHAVQHADVVADDGGLADHDARRVVHQHAAPDPAGMGKADEAVSRTSGGIGHTELPLDNQPGVHDHAVPMCSTGANQRKGG